MLADAIPMQLRVAGCVLIVAFVRALNLAVPVLYRNAINKLAEVTNLVHPRGAEKPEHFTFMEVSTATLSGFQEPEEMKA